MWLKRSVTIARAALFTAARDQPGRPPVAPNSAGGLMEAIVARDNLKKALARVKRNKGAPTATPPQNPTDGAAVAVGRNPQGVAGNGRTLRAIGLARRGRPRAALNFSVAPPPGSAESAAYARRCFSVRLSGIALRFRPFGQTSNVHREKPKVCDEHGIALRPDTDHTPEKIP